MTHAGEERCSPMLQVESLDSNHEIPDESSLQPIVCDEVSFYTEDRQAIKDPLNLSLEDYAVQIHVSIGKTSNAVQIGGNNHMYVNGRKHTNREVKTGTGGRKVAQIKVPKHIISDDDIEKMALHLGNDWRRLGLKLGFGRGELDAFEYDNQMAGLHEIIYQMLSTWKEKQGIEAYARFVASKLVDIKRADVAKLLSV